MRTSEAMTLYGFLRIVRRHWLVLVAAVALGVLAGGQVYVLTPHVYTSNLRMFVSADVASDNPEAANQGAQLSEQRAKSYARLATGSVVGERIVRDLRLGEDPSIITGKITATSPTGSVLVDVSVTDTTAEGAAQIAAEVGRVLPSIAADLENPGGDRPGATPPVRIGVAEQARVPDDPATPPLILFLAVGLVGGVVAGLVLALLRNSVDRSIRSRRALRAVTGAPTLARFAITEPGDGPGWSALTTVLSIVGVGSTRSVIAIASAQHQEGRSTVVHGLAAEFAAGGHTVLVLDADGRPGSVGSRFGAGADDKGLVDVLVGGMGVRSVVQRTSVAAVDVMPIGTPDLRQDALFSPRLHAVLDEVRARYDVILVDTPPVLLDDDAASILINADGVVLLCRAGRTTENQIRASTHAVRAFGAPLLGAVLTIGPLRRRGEERAESVPTTPPVEAGEDAETVDIDGPTVLVPAVGERRGQPGLSEVSDDVAARSRRDG